MAVRIHMLRRNRDSQPDPAAMPPGVNINMLEDRRLNHVVFVPGQVRLLFGCRSGAQFRWRTWGSMRTLEVEIGAEALEMTTTLAMLVRLALGAVQGQGPVGLDGPSVLMESRGSEGSTRSIGIFRWMPWTWINQNHGEALRRGGALRRISGPRRRPGKPPPKCSSGEATRSSVLPDQGEGREAVFGNSEGGREGEGEGIVFVGSGEDLGGGVRQGWPSGARS